MSNESELVAGALEGIVKKPKIGMIVLYQISIGEWRPFILTKINPSGSANGRIFLDSYEDERILKVSLLGIGSLTFLAHDINKGDAVGTWKFEE